jgi:hypothetical protein
VLTMPEPQASEAKVKLKISSSPYNKPRRPRRGIERHSYTLSLASALDSWWVVKATLRSLYPGKEISYPLHRGREGGGGPKAGLDGCG